MKKLLLLFGIIFLSAYINLSAVEDNNNELQDRSTLDNQLINPGETTYPLPFTKKGANARTSPAISTGYYFVDSREIRIPTFWRPSPRLVPLDFEPNLWRKILSGPRQVDSTFWEDPANKDLGLAFFRNPAKPATGSYFMHDVDPQLTEFATDSTNEAFAGPIPIGISGGFYFNGIRYDSFYVSTNGVIALTNRRYFYDSEGQITIPPGAETAYDPMSMDWFATGRGRNDAPTGLEPNRLPDNFGYQYAVLGNNKSNRLAGIRNPLYSYTEPSNPSIQPSLNSSNQNGLVGYEPANKAALIAPFWGPLAMNTYNTLNKRPIDFSEVWYKKNITSDKLIIYFKNMTIQYGRYANRFSNNQYSMSMPYNPIFGLEQGALYASVQVILDRTDSSVTFQYGKFQGSNPSEPRGNSTINITCDKAFQRLTVAGVRGFARHINYDGSNTNAPFSAEYEQVTHFNNAVDISAGTVYGSDLAVKFQQYKNVLRIYDVQYRVRGQEKTSNLDFITVIPQDEINNYELLAGEEKIGALQPVITIQNLSNDIQGPRGVNYTPQGLKFRSRIKIVNEVSDEIVYSSLVDINHPNLMGASDNSFVSVKYTDANGETLAYPPSRDYTGIPPYEFAKIIFRAFEPSEYDNKYIGKLKITINAEPTNPESNEKYGDEWPFDDTVSFKIWVMKRLNTFKDDVTEFHVLDRITVPSVYKWVNLGVRAISGEFFSKYPLAPRGNYQDEKNRGSWLSSPSLAFDNQDEGGNYWNPDDNFNTPDGDELRSFPIDLSNKRNPTLSLSIQRAAYFDGIDYARGFLDREMTGPEPRVIINDNPFDQYLASATSASRYTDMLSVEFAYPSPNGIKFITNIPNDLWKQHKVLTGNSLITNTAALSLFGAGGYQIGFLETNKDSALTLQQGLRADKFDDGFDWDFKKFFIRIPSYILNAADGGARNFRFRIKEWAYEYFQINQNSSPIPDDNDMFIVDNVAIISQGEDADIEVSSVKVHWPYSAIPASQATKIPVKVIISNNTAVQSEEFALKTFITNDGGDTVYCNIANQPLLREGKTIEVPLPEWNARLSGPGNYRLHTQMFYIGNSTDYRDLDQSNDYNYSDFDLRFSDSYVYETNIDTAGANNDVPRFTPGMPGRGLNLRGYNYGGVGNASNILDRGEYVSNSQLIAGYPGGDGSGEIAVKFEVFTQDTIYGFKAFFGNMSVDRDNIYLKVYNDAGNGLYPGLLIEGSNIERYRGLDDITNQYSYNSYITYLLDNPIQLNAGTYWVAIVQRGAYGLELGAKGDRMAMRTTSLGIRQPTNQNNILGELGNSLLIDKNLRVINRAGQLVNNNLFCYQNTSEEGSWNLFMPNTGNPAYAHLDHFGTTPEDGLTSYTFSRGTWLPMLRPYFRQKEYGRINGSIPCPDPVPVELSEFTGQLRNNNVELYWRTASETNNKGFYVEKALEGSDYEAVAFIDGHGTTTSMSEYSYKDSKVENGNTYLYRLKQIDMDATQCAKYSNIVRINVSDNLVSHKVGPNPFNSSTVITVSIPSTSNVKLDIMDMLGNEIINLVNKDLKAGNHPFTWNGTDAQAIQLPSASYIYRLNVDGVISYGKVTLAR